MKKINIISSLVLFVCFFASILCAELKVPKLTGRVVDKAGILSSAEKSQVTAAVKALESGTGGQMAVLIIPSLEGDSLEEFSIKVADAWKIGHKNKDNGAILLISQKDRKIRLEIGDGWEGFVNDARAGDIIRAMGPFFRNSEFDKGIIYAISSVHKYVTGKASAYAPPVPKQKPKGHANTLIAIIFLFLCIFAFASVIRGVFYGTSGITFYGGGYRRGGYNGGGGWSSGGGGFSGGGFSGGGGGFSGGGASGGW